MSGKRKDFEPMSRDPEMLGRLVQVTTKSKKPEFHAEDPREQISFIQIGGAPIVSKEDVNNRNQGQVSEAQTATR